MGRRVWGETILVVLYESKSIRQAVACLSIGIAMELVTIAASR